VSTAEKAKRSVPGLDFSCAEGCVQEALDLLRYLVRHSGPELVGVHVIEIKRDQEMPGAGLSYPQNALEVVAQVMTDLESGLSEIRHADKRLAAWEQAAE
jgi:hypothetical protein